VKAWEKAEKVSQLLFSAFLRPLFKSLPFVVKDSVASSPRWVGQK
jgi:hypothetical protein